VTTVYLELAEEVKSREPLDEPARDALLARVQARQQAVDYPGDYASWIEAATPPDRV
jgi:hypothetical protein